MAVDAYTVIAAARRRGVPEAAIAWQLGLREGQSAYGVFRPALDREAVVVVPGDKKPAVERPIRWPLR